MSSAQTLFPIDSESFCFPGLFGAGKRGNSDSSRSRKKTAGAGNRSRAVQPKNRVLLLGRMHELALYRAEVLRQRGFNVQISTDTEESLNLVRRNHFDIVVLSYTLSSDLVERLAEEVREHCPQCPIVVIANSDRLDRRVNPDQVAIAEQGPPALVAALQRALRRD